MRLSINKNKDGTQNLYVIKSYRNDKGVSTSKVFEKLGTYDELKKVHDDPIAWANKHVEELNKLEKENVAPIIVKYSPATQLEKDKAVRFEGGYLFIQKIYHELRLDYICKKISKKYKFEYDLNQILSRLVYARILSPSSKLTTFDYSSKLLEAPKFNLHDIYRALDVIADEYEYIQSSMYKFSKDISKRNDKILYYDCTNYYFEIEEERGMAKYGFSKEHRPNPIVQMGLFMDGDGIPLAFCLNDGNTNEQITMRPLEQSIVDDFQHSRFVVCTDAGLSSLPNKMFNDTNDRGFITVQSIKKMKEDLQKWTIKASGWKLVGSNSDKTYNINTILKDKDLYNLHFDSVFYKEQELEDTEHSFKERLIVTFSIKYRNYCRKLREKHIKKAIAVINRDTSVRTNSHDYKRFIKKTKVTTEGEIAEKTVYVLDENAIKKEQQFDGLYAVTTDLLDPIETITKISKGRWEIEECFRIMKSEFKSRPVYLQKDNRILAHFTTCFIALTVFRYLEKRLQYKYTCNQIIDGLNDIKFHKVDGFGYISDYTRNDFTDDLHDAFGFRTDFEFISKSNMKKIFSDTKKK